VSCPIMAGCGEVRSRLRRAERAIWRHGMAAEAQVGAGVNAFCNTPARHSLHNACPLSAPCMPALCAQSAHNLRTMHARSLRQSATAPVHRELLPPPPCRPCAATPRRLPNINVTTRARSWCECVCNCVRVCVCARVCSRDTHRSPFRVIISVYRSVIFLMRWISPFIRMLSPTARSRPREHSRHFVRIQGRILQAHDTHQEHVLKAPDLKKDTPDPARTWPGR